MLMIEVVRGWMEGNGRCDIVDMLLVSRQLHIKESFTLRYFVTTSFND